MARTILTWDAKRTNYSSENFGINLPWLNKHDGNQLTNWLNTDYDSTKIEEDLVLLDSLGIKKIRVFMQIESVMSYNGTVFAWDSSARANLNDFMDKCATHGMSVIAVMSAGNHDGNYASLDGKFRWDFPKTQVGIDKLLAAQTLYINELKTRDILMFEFCNEPYGELTWSTGAQMAGTTKDQMHDYLVQSYENAKLLTGIYVGFSDIEEEEQAVYQTFSSATNRENYIDDCTDVYSLHIYRPDKSYVYDFRGLTNKPKWVTEFGHLNYNDPSAESHPLAGRLELYRELENFEACVSIANKALNSGFELIMPWSLADNNGMILHNADGSHSIKKYTQFIKNKMNSSRTASGTRIAAGTRTSV